MSQEKNIISSSLENCLLKLKDEVELKNTALYIYRVLKHEDQNRKNYSIKSATLLTNLLHRGIITNQEAKQAKYDPKIVKHVGQIVTLINNLLKEPQLLSSDESGGSKKINEDDIKLSEEHESENNEIEEDEEGGIESVNCIAKLIQKLAVEIQEKTQQ